MRVSHVSIHNESFSAWRHAPGRRIVWPVEENTGHDVLFSGTPAGEEIKYISLLIFSYQFALQSDSEIIKRNCRQDEPLT